MQKKKNQHKVKITQQSLCTSEFYLGEEAGENIKDNLKSGAIKKISYQVVKHLMLLY